jgi:hypothetical protein
MLQFVRFGQGRKSGRVSRKHYSHSLWFRLAPVEVRWSKKTLRDYWIKFFAIVILTAMLVVAFIGPKIVKAQLLNPVVESNAQVHVFYLPLPENEDTWVTKYAKMYGKTPGEVNHTRELLHCLLYNEAGYGSNKGKGDGGLASGPLQFHQATYIGYRKIMMKQGLVKEMGDRDNMEDAINTAAWALSTGRGDAWGPILRHYCQ